MYYVSACTGPATSDTIQLIREKNLYKGWIKSWKIYSKNKEEVISKEIRLSNDEFDKFAKIENECKLFKKTSNCSIEMVFLMFKNNNNLVPYYNQSCEFTSYWKFREHLIRDGK